MTISPPFEVRGLITAITTPFTDDNHVDFKMFGRHLQLLSDHGLANILLAGTTGEFFSLSKEEKKELLVVARKQFTGSILFHVGSGTLMDSVELAHFGQQQGANGIVAILPYFLSTLETDGLVGYLKQIGDATTLPFLIYNFPKHTQVALSSEILSVVPHVAVKDSSADLSLIAHTPRYFIGSDTQVLESHRAGGAGFVSARSNCAPEIYAKLHRALLANDLDAAAGVHKEVLQLCRTYSGPRQIHLVKQGVAKLVEGYPDRVRLPLN